MVAAFEAADPSMRVPWYGPAMSLPSALTAAAETMYRTAVYDALAERNLVAHWYFTTEAGSPMSGP